MELLQHSVQYFPKENSFVTCEIKNPILFDKASYRDFLYLEAQLKNDTSNDLSVQSM